jgi:two-component system, NarL family, response regulator LiaR
MNELTERENEVVKLIAMGQSNQDIASRLFISVSTVKNHCQNIFSKLQCQSRTELALYYWQGYLQDIKNNLLSFGVPEKIVHTVINEVME